MGKTSTVKTVFALVLVVAIPTCFYCFAAWRIGSGFAERDRDSKAAFATIKHLQPLILDNAFGVYHVEFGPDSKLTDANVREILGLNRLPEKYDLTVWIKTDEVSDVSVSVLSQLTTADKILIESANLSEAGLESLSAVNPAVSIHSADGS